MLLLELPPLLLLLSLSAEVDDENDADDDAMDSERDEEDAAAGFAMMRFSYLLLFNPLALLDLDLSPVRLRP
jgi:hypothetical protein